MTIEKSSYVSPFSTRYSSEKMKFIFSEQNKFTLFRRLWIALAEAEKELGLDITDEQIDELKAHVDDINFEDAEKREKEVRHDVMSHVYAYGLQCPKAKGIIHLGATSCYVGDNTEIIQIRDALLLVKRELVTLIDAVASFATKYKAQASLAYTHFQAAQPTTIGKRATLWLQDLVFDLENLDFVLGNLKLLGCKGTTGTQASFLELLKDEQKVYKLEELIAEKMGFKECYAVSGQTYSRKIDFFVLSTLSGIAQSAHKFSNDVRLMSHLKEVDEPFESGQIGSSAMAYKRNPMRSERIASIARYVMVDALNPALTASEQWFERTLDDSANKRISVPEAFLGIDAILQLYLNIISGMKVYKNTIEKHLNEELPFMATENILMYCVSEKGKDRQLLHERIRVHSVEVARAVKERGEKNDLLSRIVGDPAFDITREEIDKLISYKQFIGLAEEQTENFVKTVKELVKNNSEFLGAEAKVGV